jgi:ABC-type Fe3+ transport system substrate-binding protein
MKIVALSVAIMVTAALPARADVDMNALYEAAKKEGALSIYGGGPKQPYLDRIARFEKQFPGIKVNFVNGPSNVLSENIDKARAAGKPVADVALLQTIQDYVAWKKAGVLTPFKFDAWNLIPDSFKDADGLFSAHSLIMIAYAHRPDLVPGEFTSAKDILNPKYKGKVISTYPHLDDATLYHYAMIAERYGWSFWEDYAKLDSKFVRGHLGVAQSLEKGESAASLDQIPSGNKVSTVVIPDSEPVTLFQQTIAIFKDAPNPNAAKLYVNWYMGKDEATFVSRDGSWSPRPDVPPPPGMKALKDLKLNAGYVAFITGDEKRIADLRAKFKAISGEWSGVDVR